MAFQRGRNGGITGDLIDIENGPTFQLDVTAWQVGQGVQSMPVAGRGDSTAWVPTIGIQPGGTVVVSGNAQFKQPPTPLLFQGRAGSIVQQFHSNGEKTGIYTTPVRIDQASWAIVKLEQDTWKITLTGTVTGFPVPSGFNGDAPAAVGAEAIDKELFSGLTKTIDPKTLIDSAERTFIVRPILNTDAAETAKITALIVGAVPAFTGAKVKTATLLPGRMQDTAIFSIAFSRTDSAEDVENPATVKNVDPSKLETGGTVAIINNASPTVPTVSGQTTVERATSSRELNDDNTLYTKEYGQRTTAEDRTMPGTWTETDPLLIESHGQKTEVYDTGSVPAAPTPPSGLQRTAAKTNELNRDRSERVTTFEDLNSEQKRGFPKVSTTDDAQNIEDAAVRYKFFDRGGTAPTAPDDVPTNNVKLVHVEDLWVSSTRDMRVFVYGPKNSRDDIVVGKIETTTDASALESTAVRACLDGETITDPAGMTLRETKTMPVTDGLAINRTLTIKFYGLRTKQQDIEYLQSRAIVEAGQLRRNPIVVRVTSSDAPDATGLNPDTTNLSLFDVTSHQETNTGKWVHVFEFRPLTAQEDVEADGTETVDDPVAFLEGGSRARLVTNSATPPASPTITGRFVVRRTTRRLGKVRWQHDWFYDFRDAAGKIEADRFRSTVDPDGLESEDVTAEVFPTDDAEPADTDPPAGLKYAEKTYLETANPLYRIRVYRWGLNTNAEKIRNEGSYHEFTQFENISRREVSVLTTADTMQTLVEAIRTAYKEDPTFDRGRIERLNDGKIRQTLEFLDQFELFDGRVYGGRKLFRSRFTGSAVQVYVADVWQDAGFWHVTIDEQSMWHAEMTFKLRKRRSLTYLPLELSLLGTRNNSDFIGIPAGYAAYLGGNPRSNRSVDVPHVMEAEYEFQYSSRGHYDEADIRTGEFKTASDMSGLSTGWTDASFFGWGAGALPGADYSGFLGP